MCKVEGLGVFHISQVWTKSNLMPIGNSQCVFQKATVSDPFFGRWSIDFYRGKPPPYSYRNSLSLGYPDDAIIAMLKDASVVGYYEGYPRLKVVFRCLIIGYDWSAWRICACND